MRFEEIAEVLTEEEGRRVSVHAVRFTYYRALEKLRKYVNDDERLNKMLHEMIEDHPPALTQVNEIIDNMVKCNDE